MVAWITSGATPAGALYYNKDKIDRGESRFLAAFNTPIQVTDERYFDIREALRCFEPYLEANRRTKNPVFHASLNPAPEDRLTNDELRQIAREYMDFCTRTSNAGISISCRCAWGSTAASWRTTSRRDGRGRSSMLWNDTTACALPPRATRSRRTTRCRNSTIRKATSNDNSHRSCARHATATTMFSVTITGQGTAIDVSGK